ncbi:MAG: glycosyltransferase [Candidatus Moranbacteria bacterium]|nr:glycosyltransferase [Candidatus Moranbacteria bacterium]
MAKKILFITSQFPAPEYRRVWKKVLSLAKEGYQIMVICPQASKSKVKKLKNIRVRYFRSYINKKKPLIFLLFELINLGKVSLISASKMIRFNFDVIHVANPSDSPALLAGFLKIFGPIFVYENNQNCLEQVNKLTDNKKFGKVIYGLFKKVQTFAVKSADLVITSNSIQRVRLAKIIPKRKNKIITIEPYPDLRDYYHPFLKKDYKRGFRYLALYAGSIRVEKGIKKFLDAIKFIRKDLGRRDILFVVAGDGQDRERIVKYANQLGVADSIFFTGWLSQKQLLTYLTVADIGIVLEDKQKQNQDLRDSIFEFMAMGKPIITFNSKVGQSRIGFAGKFIQDDNEILLAKEIIKTIDNKEKSQEMGRYGQLRIEKKFNWIKSEIKLTTTYENLFLNRDMKKGKVGLE